MSENEPTPMVEEPSRAPEPRSGAHPVHIPHLVMGLAILGLVTVWALLVPLDAVDLHDARWLLPLPWLIAGAAGLLATIFSRRPEGR
ncbi:hypothetical protein [Nocardioides montaniterrae]